MSAARQILSKTVTLPHSGQVIRNRFLKSAMTERLCVWDKDNLDARGRPTPEYIRLYEEWGKGEIGVIVLGNIPIHREHLEAKANAIIDPDSAKAWDPVEAFKPVIAAAKAHGSLVYGQLTHGGRQVSVEVNEHPVSASDVQIGPVMGMTFNKPRPLTIPEIKDLVQRWAYAAEVLYKAGADGAQLHCAHGYLLSQFLSPVANKRTDEYGGSFENRSRIVFEILTEIRRRIPDKKFGLSIKYNSHDFIEGGFSPEESREMAKKMEDFGLDLLELSGGTYESLAFEHKKESTKRREGFFLEFAERIRPHLKNTVLAVTGGFRSAEAMAKAIQDKTCDIVGLGRPLIPEPFFCRDILSGKSIAAKPNLIPDAIQIVVAIGQIHDIANGRPVVDTSDKNVVERITHEILGGGKGAKDEKTKKADAVDGLESDAQKAGKL